MSFGAPASGPGGAGSGSGSQGNGAQDATVSAQVVATTTKAISTATLMNSHPTTTSTSTNTPSGSSFGAVKTAIIGGVVGGIVALLLLSLLGIWLLQRRKKRKIAEKNGSAEPVTYAGLNSAFAGVPFAHSPNQEQHDGLLATPEHHPSTSTLHSGGAIRGGGTSPYIPRDRNSDVETDHFLPTYAQSQSGMSLGSAGHSLTPIRTSVYIPVDRNVSPISQQRTGQASTISPQTTGDPAFISPQSTSVSSFAPLPPVAPSLVPQRTRDTMGFPADRNEPLIESGPYQNIPLVAPVPVHPLIHQESLERVVREGMVTTPEPNERNSHLPAGNRQAGGVAQVLSQEMPRESPILGNRNQVRMYPPEISNRLNQNVRRNESQRTTSSVSSMWPSVISDGELERLGVRSRVV